MRTLLLALASLALVTACSAGRAAPSTAGSLTGTEWTRTDDADASPHFATISFTERRASGYSGCNAWFATPRQNGEQLHFSGVTTSPRHCDADPGRAPERSFLSALRNVRRAIVQNEELIFYAGDGQEIARFAQANAPDRTAAEIGAPATPAATSAPPATPTTPSQQN